MAVPSSQCYLTPSQTNIHYVSSGNPQGPLIVFLHGLGGSTETFHPIIPYFPQHCHLVAVDVEGFGKTPRNQNRPLSFPHYVDDLHCLIAYLQEQDGRDSAILKTVLIGHSLGGIVSLHYGAQYPTEVAGLMLLGVGRSVKGIPAAQKRMRDLATTAREQGMDVVAELAVKTNFPADLQNDDLKNQVRREVGMSDAESYALTAETISGDNHVDPDYGNISCPSMFVAGDADMISPVERSEGVSRLMGGPSEVEVVKGGHQMILQDMDGVTKAVSRFLAMVGITE